MNGCNGEVSVEVSVKGKAIVNKLTPDSFFSPNNNDDKNKNWEVKNITDYPQRGAVIYDDKSTKGFISILQ